MRSDTDTGGIGLREADSRPVTMPARSGLAQLEARVREDLACLNHPPANWTHAPIVDNACDVLIVGGGMCGLVAWFALAQAGLRNVRVIDRSEAGREGPWITYARMETLRSPKTLTGPAFGVPSLTFRAWYTAQHGTEAWDRMDRIPRPLWMDYLRWYRAVLDIPVENGLDAKAIRPRADGLLEVEIAGGKMPAIITRRLVLATGRDGLGAPTIPAFMAGLERHRLWAHSSDPVDFAELRGKRVVVVGVGASAVDNAAEALEAGAAEVRLLARRPTMPTVNKLMGVGSYGLTAAQLDMAPEWRWRLMHYAARQQTPAPHNSTLRVSRHANAFFHFNCGIEKIEEADGGILVATQNGRRFHTDFVILGTGFSVDASQRPEVSAFAHRIARWKDRYVPPPGEESGELGLYPWLNDDFSFSERTPGEAPWLSRIHCFNYASALSLGKVSGDIPAISEGARWLARSLASRLFIEEMQEHWADLQAYSHPELDGSEWTDADAPASQARTAGEANA